jgi:7-cyano-7-deazaguanine reductase
MVLGDGRPVAVELRYVPDRLILRPVALGRYLEAMGGESWESLEALATAVLEDLNNETVARWLQVELRLTAGGKAGEEGALADHAVLLEERQPKWDNPTLLSRLERR